MILVLDIGNSQVYGGVFDDERLALQFRRATRAENTSDEFGLFCRQVLRENDVDPAAIASVAICSVVPDMVHSVRNASMKYFGLRPFLLEPGVRRLRRGHDRVTHTARRFSRRDLSRMLAEAGAEVVRCTGAYTFLVPPAAVLAVLERGRSTSDVGRNESGLGGAMPALAELERALLRRVDLPTGLSAIAVGRKC